MNSAVWSRLAAVLAIAATAFVVRLSIAAEQDCAADLLKMPAYTRDYPPAKP